MWRGNGAVEIKWKARGRLEKGEEVAGYVERSEEVERSGLSDYVSPVLSPVLASVYGSVLVLGLGGVGKVQYQCAACFTPTTMRCSKCIVVRYWEETALCAIYTEFVQDLLAPLKVSIPVVEDIKNGEVSIPCATVVKIQLPNTMMNTESSRNLEILKVSFRRSIQDKE
ncbi:hypothetical protein Tco_0530658 [Tanacetum coccineum]